MKTHPESHHKNIPNPEDGNKAVIKDVIVADPSIEFDIELVADHFPDQNGIYIRDLEVQILLSNAVTNNVKEIIYTRIGTISVKSVSQLDLYFALPFGDTLYQPGQQFKLQLLLSGFSPIDGSMIHFNNENNSFSFDVFGSGISKHRLKTTPS